RNVDSTCLKGISTMWQMLRKFLIMILACLALGLPTNVSHAVAARATAPNGPVGWQTVPAILARIKVPKFPKRDFKITDYGARSGDTDNTDQIRKAIDACHAS